MPDIGQYSSSPRLKPADLLDESGDAIEYDAIVDRVEDVTYENKDGTKERKPVMYFRGWSKHISMPQTNLEQMAEITGDRNTDNWGGTPITLFHQPNVMGNKAGIRIKNKQPDAAAAADASPPPAAVPLD